MVADLHRINLTYQEYPAIRESLISEEQMVVRVLNFDFSKRSEKMLLALLAMAEQAGMAKPDI